MLPVPLFVKPVSASEYLTLVSAKAAPHADLKLRLAVLAWLLGTEEDHVQLQHRDGARMGGRTGCVGLVVIVPLEAAAQVLTAATYDVWNWHYDRTTQHLLVNLQRCRHELLSANLHKIYVGSEQNTETAAERFIDEGLGWFKSSASRGRMLIGRNVTLTAPENLAFESVPAYPA